MRLNLGSEAFWTFEIRIKLYLKSSSQSEDISASTERSKNVFGLYVGEDEVVV